MATEFITSAFIDGIKYELFKTERGYNIFAHIVINDAIDETVEGRIDATWACLEELFLDYEITMLDYCEVWMFDYFDHSVIQHFVYDPVTLAFPLLERFGKE